jgi:hypothetical protein
MRILTVVAAGLLGLVVFAATTPAEATDTNAGGVACRTQSTSDGTSVLSLKWEGASAKGTLEHIGQSGNVTTYSVRAERQDGMIIADDVFQTDLASHAAVVREQNGKRYMRAEGGAWLACQ